MMIMMKIIAIKIIKNFFDNNYYDKNNNYLTIFTHILQNQDFIIMSKRSGSF